MGIIQFVEKSLSRPPGAALLDIGEEGVRMKHEGPVAERMVDHRARLGSRTRLDARARCEKPDAVLHPRHVRGLPSRCKLNWPRKNQQQEGAVIPIAAAAHI